MKIIKKTGDGLIFDKEIKEEKVKCYLRFLVDGHLFIVPENVLEEFTRQTKLIQSLIYQKNEEEARIGIINLMTEFRLLHISNNPEMENYLEQIVIYAHKKDPRKLLLN